MTDVMTRVFGALADPVRCALVAHLAAHGDSTVAALAAPQRISKQAVSKHLHVLEAAGVVSRTGAGHRRPVHLETDVFDRLTGWADHHRRIVEARYDRLDDLLATLVAGTPGDTDTDTDERPERTR